MDNLYFIMGVIVGYLVSALFNGLHCMLIYFRDRARYLDKKDYKAFNKWKEKQ